jgi:hypothetical protein
VFLTRENRFAPDVIYFPLTLDGRRAEEEEEEEEEEE